MMYTAILLVLAGASARQAPSADGPRAAGEVLVLPGTGVSGRIAVLRDALVGPLADGSWRAPAAGATVADLDGTPRAWTAAAVTAEGRIEPPPRRGNYVWWPVDSPGRRTMILDARGHSLVYVNGQPRYGDPYGLGYTLTPVQLESGRNGLLFLCSRELQVRLVEPAAAVQLNTRDVTLPDLLIGHPVAAHAAIVVLNCTAEAQADLQLTATVGTDPGLTTNVPRLLPFSAYKVPFKIAPSGSAEPGQHPLVLTVHRPGQRPIHTATLDIHLRAPRDRQRRTYVSAVDGSVQYYAVLPANPRSPHDPAPGLLLSTHGAGVEAWNQAGSYAPKTWVHIVAPTNRRMYGFDWEDWGRLDALEVLADAGRHFHHDTQRVYLSGHSMGGHGAWHLATTYPDRFAAVGPSAGWMSFWSYGSRPFADDATPIGRLLNRTTSPGRTRLLARNLRQMGVYILHGDADDNVPVDQARQMRAQLGAFHEDLHYHEQAGAGHWWGTPEEPGTECLDWAPMFDLFSRRRIPRNTELRDIEFITANPAVSSSCHWLTVAAQQVPLAQSSVTLRYDPGARRLWGSTTNVARMALDITAFAPGKTITCDIDGQTLECAWPQEPQLWLVRSGETWAVGSRPDPRHKGPQRNGPFKEAFSNRFLLVYGTHGTAEETAWAQAKARFDAEAFLYRANASVDVMSDTAFLDSPTAQRHVILYGNADTHGAWSAVVEPGDVTVTREAIHLGPRTLRGADLGCLMVRPRLGSHRALVGIVGGTGLVGQRITTRLPYFVSGIAYPDLTVFDSTALRVGEAGIVAAGFFGPDWSVKTGEFAWRAAVPATPAPPDDHQPR